MTGCGRQAQAESGSGFWTGCWPELLPPEASCKSCSSCQNLAVRFPSQPRNKLPMLQTIRHHPERQCLNLCCRSLGGLPVGKHASQFRNLGKPATIVLLLDLDPHKLPIKLCAEACDVQRESGTSLPSPNRKLREARAPVGKLEASREPCFAGCVQSGRSMVMENTPADSAIRPKTNLHAAPSQPLKPSVTKSPGTARFIPYDLRLHGTEGGTVMWRIAMIAGPSAFSG